MSRKMSRMKRYKDKERKNIIVAIIFLIAVLMTAGYAAYSRNLIIDSTGGVLNDWSLEFTYIDTPVITGFAEEYNSPQIGTDTFTGDLIFDVEVALSFPTDEISYEIEISNFSETWDAEFVVYSVVYSVPSNGNYIVWTVSDIVAGDKILSNDGVNDNTWLITLTASWNPLLDTSLPVGTTMDYATTYKESATIVLVFDAV